jgi:hypothetical protein
MPTPPTPSDPSAAAPIPVPHEERFRQAWERYGNTVYTMCAIVVAGILAKGGWDYLVAQKELGIQRDYAECTSAEAFRAFASSHPGHPLAGVADLKVADNAYGMGRFADAVAGYERCIAELPAGPFKARAKLGLAIAQAQSGRAADAEAGLRQLLSDSSQLNAIRCEAGYHLAEVAYAAGRTEDVQRLAEQLMQIDPTSAFAERAFALRAQMPEPVAPAAGTPSGPGIVLPQKH